MIFLLRVLVGMGLLLVAAPTACVCFQHRHPHLVVSFLHLSWRRRQHNHSERAVTATAAMAALQTTTRLYAAAAVAKTKNPLAASNSLDGLTHSASSFATHVLATRQDSDANTTVQQIVDRALVQLRRTEGNSTAAVTDLDAMELLDLGACWFLSKDKPRDPALGGKPVRLRSTDSSQRLHTGDYLRIHHNPRRFPVVHDYDWSKKRIIVDHDNAGDCDVVGHQEQSDSSADRRPGVVVDENESLGWMVIDKPAGVSVHPTVDNARENVASCLLRVKQQQQQQQHLRDGIDEQPPYVATPQRLDQNTSGLLVTATTKKFAAYYAQLLRFKTAKQLGGSGGSGSSGSSGSGRDLETESVGGIHKLYRCLVCLVPPLSLSSSLDCSVKDDDTKSTSTWSSTWSVAKAAQELQSFASTGTVIRHYLQPSIRAPKRYVLEKQIAEEWPECLMKIRKASAVYALIGNDAGTRLARGLWNSSDESIPANCQAVVELEVELLTGRTHQIRGQLSAMSFPLAGDAQYGGSQPLSAQDIDKIYGKKNKRDYYVNSDRLALQCCELEFIVPDLVKTGNKGEIALRRSKQWSRFRLDKAWWTPLLKQYDDDLTSCLATAPSETATTSLQDDAFLMSEEPSSPDTVGKAARPDLLPARVSLSPGKHKYVLIQATHPTADDEWFVKSASPSECGGPYHGNVAQDLREWIEAAGYKAIVTGGGRIDYRSSSGQAVVYGFSYGFGKGDHAKAAGIISAWSGGSLDASVCDAEGLY